jgi:UrcA family protein
MKANAIHRKTAFVSALLMGITAVGIAASARAGESAVQAVGVTRVVVRYGDLDLTSPEGARTLYARLGSAASKACGGEPGTRDLLSRMSYQDCRSTALDHAVNRIGSSQLQALHDESKEGTSVG